MNLVCDFKIYTYVYVRLHKLFVIIKILFCVDEPDAPEKPVVKDWDEDHVDLEWEKPKSDGGSPIQEYIIQKKEKGNLYWANAATVPGNTTKVSVSWTLCHGYVL